MRRSPTAQRALGPPPLRHALRVSTLGSAEGAQTRVHLSADADARARIARFLEIEAVERMTLTGRLVPVTDGWEFRGQLTATVLQACVVTLEPVRAAIDTPVRRRFLEGLVPPEDAERVLVEADLDPPEPLGREIDLGHLAVETLALSLDPWPRSAGAEFAPHGSSAGADADAPAPERPFAGLANLRARLAREDD